MIRRTTITLVAFLIGLLAVYGVFHLPLTVGAQGGSAVFQNLGIVDTLRVGGVARFEGPVYGVGPQDAASDILTADMNVMSTTWVTVMSASVTTVETIDSVQVHVTGQFGLMNPLYIVDASGDELWSIDDISNPSGAHLVGAFPSALDNPNGIASHGGALYIVDSSSPRRLWRLNDLSDPSSATNLGSFPSDLNNPSGIASHGGALYIVSRSSADRLWRLNDLSDPSSATNLGSFPSDLNNPSGIASHGGALYIVDLQNNDFLWRIDNPSNPGGAISVGSIGAMQSYTPTGITSYGGELYFLNGHINLPDSLVRIDNPGTRARYEVVGFFPLNFENPQGITSVGPMGPCMVRLARGNTSIQEVTFPDKILFDAKFVDSPPVGTNTYSLQIQTVHPSGCAALLGNGLVPMPSLFVQSYYGGNTP